MPPEPKIAPDPKTELEELAREYRHVRAEHEREGVEGSWRRRQEARLARIEKRFESVLTRNMHDEDTRDRWRRYLYRGNPSPG